MPRKKVVPEATAAAAASAPDADDSLGISKFELPKSIIIKVAKGAVKTTDVKLQKEVPLALTKGSTVFISYLAGLAHDVATSKSQKTITAAHVLEAIKDLQWAEGPELTKMLKSELNAFRTLKDAKSSNSAPSTTTTTSAPQPPKPLPSKSDKGKAPALPTYGSPGVAEEKGKNVAIDEAGEGARMLVDDRRTDDEAYGEGEEEEEDEDEQLEEDEEGEGEGEGDEEEEPEEEGLGADEQMAEASEED